MKMNETCTRADFLQFNFCWAFNAYIAYNAFMMRSVEGMSMGQSRWLLAGMLLFMLGSVIFLEEEQLTDERWMFNVIMPFGLYTCLTHYSDKPQLFHIVGIAAAVLLVIYAVLMLGWKPALTEDGRRRRKMPVFCRGARTLASTGMIGIMAFSLVNVPAIPNFRHSVVKQEVTAKNAVCVGMKMLAKLDEEVWDTLTEQEKLDVMQMIANSECDELGLPHELHVGVREIREEGTLAYYTDDWRRITVDWTHLQEDSSWEVVDTICHEAYHALQHREVEVYWESDEELRDLKIFDTAKQYIQEFRNYNDGSEDFDGYYEQLLEETARDYARKATDRYFHMLYGEPCG